MNKSALFAFAPVATAVVIAGCGGSGTGGGYSTGAPPKTGSAALKPATATTKSGSGGPTVALAGSKFGQIVVDGRGRTVYLFVADKTTTSTCYGACASVWPPLTVSGLAKAGPHTPAALLGTTKRTDGTTEATYKGHPLYYYAGDTKPGDTNGQNVSQFGAPWYVLNGNGEAVTSNG
jgi:predicted lipoprotein with Yx(FWY)xxD motif